MISSDVKLTGTKAGLDRKLTEAALRGLRLGGEHVLRLSREVVPIEEGTLERSGRVTDDGQGTVAVSYDTPYAVRQHEDLGASHDGGRTAKYLERPSAEASDDVAALVRAEMRRVTGG